MGASPEEESHHAPKLAFNKPLEGQLEPRRKRERTRHLLHFTGGSGVGLRLGIVDRRSNEVLKHRLFGRIEQAFIDVDGKNAPLGGRLDLHQTTARGALDLDLVEIVLSTLELVLGVLRHFHDFIEIGHLGHVRLLSLSRIRARRRGTHPSPSGHWDRQALRSERAPRRFSPDRGAKAPRTRRKETLATLCRSTPSAPRRAVSASRRRAAASASEPVPAARNV